MSDVGSVNAGQVGLPAPSLASESDSERPVATPAGASGGNRILMALDEIERRVECFRKQALAIEREKEDLLQCLHNLSLSEEAGNLTPCDREELEANAFSLTCRCLTVNVSITVPRNDFQEDALKSAHTYIECILAGTDNGKLQKIQSLINASTSEQLYKGIPGDEKFQTILLGCAAEDQKNIQKHLVDVLNRHSNAPNQSIAID